MTRDEILEAIRRTAEENGGVPLGARRLEQVTGIRPYDIGRHWARFGDAQREAGFEANTLNAGYSDEFLMEKLIGLTRELGRVPTTREMRLKKSVDPEFPNTGVYERLGTKPVLLEKLRAYCAARTGYGDILELCKPHPDTAEVSANDKLGQSDRYGFVYLVRAHPGEYKIGRTNLVDRRLSELGAASAVEQTLIHEIKTDDPVGVEAYWHQRFADKRMRGEWFKLRSDDVAAFRRWRRIF